MKMDDNNDWFFDKFENTATSLPKTLFKLGLVALLLNLIFWGLIIAGIIFGLSLIL